MIVNVRLPEVPPPGEGVNTVTEAVPAAARSALVMAARSCVALTTVVGRAEPFQRATDEAVNPLPVTVRVKPALPAAAPDGAIPVICGAGGTGWPAGTDIGAQAWSGLWSPVDPTARMQTNAPKAPPLA